MSTSDQVQENEVAQEKEAASIDENISAPVDTKVAEVTEAVEKETEEDENQAEVLLAETENLCASMEKSFRRILGDMPSQVELADLHGCQATMRDLVDRSLQSSAGAQDELNTLTKERDEFKEAATRAKADFLNYQERAKRDLASAEESALRGIVSDLLPILDSLDLALNDANSEQANPETIRSAVEMMASAMEQTLKVRGLVRIEAKGKPFDANYHEAVCIRPVDAEKEEEPNQVVEELRPGFTWKEKLLRPCQVLVTEKEKQKD